MASTKMVLWGSVAAAALVFGLIQTWRVIAPNTENGHLPSSFPRAYLASSDHGIDKIKLWRGRIAPPTIEIDGTTCYPAWTCNNAACPGRADNAPFIFAYGPGGSASQGPYTACVKCAAAFTKAAEAQRGSFDPSNISAYYTPEAQTLIAAVQSNAR